MLKGHLPRVIYHQVYQIRRYNTRMRSGNPVDRRVDNLCVRCILGDIRLWVGDTSDIFLSCVAAPDVIRFSQPTLSLSIDCIPQVLQVEVDATTPEIKKAYRKMSLMFVPTPLSTTTLHKCAAVPRRAYIQGS